MTEDPAGPHFELFRERFREAAEAVGGVEERFIRVAGARVRLVFAGAELAAVYEPSFQAPLADPGPGPGGEVTIEVFDTAGSGIAAPQLPWRRENPSPEHVARYDGTEVTSLQDFGSPALTLARPADGVAVHHVPSAASVSWVERGTAFRFALMALLGARDLHFVHAAAVGADGNGALLAGPSGAGKSTLSMACLRAGMQWAGDDYVVVEPGPPAVAHVLHVIAKLTPASLEMLGAAGMVTGAAEPPERKAVVVVPASDPRLAAALELRGILIPRLGVGGPRVKPASPAQSFAALAPTTMFQVTSRRRSSLAAIGALSRDLPSAIIELGEDHSENATAVAEAIDAF